MRGHNNPRGQGVLPGRWSVRSEGLAKGAVVSKARAHQPGGTWGPAQAVVGVSGRACEGGCSLQGPGTQAWGDRGCSPGLGRYVVKGLRGGLHPSNPGHTSLGDQGVPPKRWSVCPEGSVRGAAISKARTNQPGGTAVLDRAMVGASGRTCVVGCNLQSAGTPAWGERGSCQGGGRFVPKGLRGGLQSSEPGHTNLGGHGVLPRRWSVCREGPARGAAVSKAGAHQHGGGWGSARAVVGAS